MKIMHIGYNKNFTEKFIIPLLLSSKEEVYLVSPLAKNHGKISALSLDLGCRQNPVTYLKSIFNCLRSIKRRKIDWVVTHTAVDSFLTIIFCKLFSNVKVIYVNHGVSYIGCRGIVRWALIMVEFFNLKLSNSIITITPSMKPYLTNVFNRRVSVFSPGSITGVVLNYSTYEILAEKKLEARKLLGYCNDEHVVLYVGRPVKRKGLFDVIDAVKACTSKIRLVLVGVEEAHLNESQYADNIECVGFLADVDCYFAAADVLCLPSHHEGLGQVYLEAASFGCVPICSNIPGPTDFVRDNVNGLCVEPKNPQLLAEKIDALFACPNQLKGLSKAAFFSAQIYNREIVIKKNWELINEEISFYN